MSCVLPLLITAGVWRGAKIVTGSDYAYRRAFCILVFPSEAPNLSAQSSTYLPANPVPYGRGVDSGTRKSGSSISNGTRVKARNR